MAKYTQILNGKAHWVFESDETLEELRGRFAPDCVFMDITDINPQPQEQWDFDGVNFIAPTPTNTLKKAREYKLEELRQAAEIAYTGGFFSSALGERWYYDSSREDQTLLEGLYNRAKEDDWSTYERYPGVCPAGYAPIRARRLASDPDTAKQVLAHDAEQLTQLGRDLEKHLFVVKVTHWQLQAAVAAAETVEAVEAISWPVGA